VLDRYPAVALVFDVITIMKMKEEEEEEEERRRRKKKMK
jgi:hypothetical protein